MKLSVIILNYNVRYFLEACLRSVQAAIAQVDAEIIVIDNNSPDDSCAMVKTLFPDVTLIENKENVGFSKANNQGVAIAKGEYVCILNPDTIVPEDVFTKLIKFSQGKEKLGIIGCKLVDGSGAFLPESKRNLPTPKVSIKKILGSKNANYYADHVHENEIGAVQILVGAFMFLKRTVYTKVNGFDEDYFMYGEDIDISYKVEKAGFQNYYFGETTVIHYKGESTLKDKVYAKRFYNAMRIFYKKHLKSNFLYDIMVVLGTAIIPLFSKKEKEQEQKVDTYILFHMTETISETIQEKHPNMTFVTIADNDALKKYLATKAKHQTIAIIFDNHNTTFKAIIAIVEAQLAFYKIVPKNSTFFLGSNSAKSRGKVVVLTKN